MQCDRQNKSWFKEMSLLPHQLSQNLIRSTAKQSPGSEGENLTSTAKAGKT